MGDSAVSVEQRLWTFDAREGALLGAPSKTYLVARATSAYTEPF